jgi:hypothetical protein
MPTKKQRRREQKTRRHEYGYFDVDEEGNEVEVDPRELAAERNARKAEAREQKPKPQAAAAAPARGPRGRRVPEPPSWRRVGRRALIFGPIMIVAMMLLNRNLPLAERVAPALFFLVLFLPFSYFTDSMAYRMYRKRVDQRTPQKR